MSFWEKNRNNNYRQTWEGEADKFSSGNMWVTPSQCDEKYTKEMRLATQKLGLRIDRNCLENDDKIDENFVIKYTPHNHIEVRYAQLLTEYPREAALIAGQAGFHINYGIDTSGIAMSFAEAGGKGSDRGGLAFSFYQNFDEKWYKNEKKGTESWHGPLDGTQVNAARHTLWNMLNVQAVGFDVFGRLSSRGLGAAKSAVDLHESNPYALKNKKTIFDPDDYKQSSSNPNDINRRGCSPEDGPNECALKQADETTDLLNNRIGRNLGLKYPQGTSPRDLALGMLDQFYFDGLYTIQKIGGKYHVLLTRITKEQYDHLKNVYTNEVDEFGHKIKPNKYIQDPTTSPFLWKKHEII